jgi:hypothetical protein
MAHMTKIWRENRLLVIAFAIALAMTLFFAVRLAIFSLYWSDPAHRRQQMQPWMTIGYVARSWQVPKDRLARELDVVPTPGKPPTLKDIAEKKGMTVEALEAQIEAVIRELDAGKPRP